MSLPPLTFNAWLRFGLINRMLRGLQGIQTVLEIGGGEGALGARLARRFDYVGLEPDDRSFAKAKARVDEVGRGTVIHGDLSALDPSATFDLVCAFEVLEHIEEDASALAEWRERLRPGGWLLLSVPAHPQRYGPWDRWAGHYRRYERAQLSALLASGGFTDVQVWAYGFPLGYLLEWARDRIAARDGPRRSMAERTAASGRRFQPADGLGWLTCGVSAPFRLVQRPFTSTELGTGLVARARRPE
ncbi:MAG: class I SAM-dependent methyltransferase [Actinomycetota bacterium]